MTRQLVPLLAILCLGCAPAAQDPVAPVDPAPIEAVRPTGPNPVGVADGPDLGAAGASRVYYPAGQGGEAQAERFSPDHVKGLQRRFGVGAGDALGRAVTSARRDAPRLEGRFPLVVFQPGANMGSGDYRLLLEDVASRGYIVLALNIDGSPPPSAGRYAEAARELIQTVADIRTGRTVVEGADPTRVALMGHSLGGAATVMALADTPDAVAINLDGDYGAPTTVPTSQAVLYILGQTAGEADASRARRAGVWRTASAGAADAVALQVAALKHFDFADAAMLQADVPEDRRRTRFGAIGGPAAHALTIDLVAGFLDSRLKGDAAAWPAALSRHPEAAAPSTW